MSDSTDLAAILKRLDELETKEQIRDIVSRYGRGADRIEPSVTSSVFWPDGKLLLKGLDGTAEDDLGPLISDGILQFLTATHHLMGNMIIDLDGDQARVETYAIAHHRSRPTSESNAAMLGKDNVPKDEADLELQLIIGLRYVDVMERRDGIWKIFERRLVFDWSQAGRYSGIEEGGLYDITPYRGMQGRSDPSYQNPRQPN